MTTNITDMNPIDYLKYLVEETGHLLDAARDKIAWDCSSQHRDAAEHADHLDDVCGLIESAQREIVEAAAAFSRDGADLTTYADGRQITTTTEIEPGSYFTFTHHPSISHPDNRPRNICTLDGSDGVPKRIVLQPGGTVVAVPVEPLRVITTVDGEL